VPPAGVSPIRPGGKRFLIYEPDAVGAVETDDAGRVTSAEGPLAMDGERPRNPGGRTGLAGRGFFRYWGPNLAVDPVMVRVNPRSGDLEFLLVKRVETGQWGLPGSFLRPGETLDTAAHRSLGEKAGLGLAFQQAQWVGRWFVHDYRNTDHAWIESDLLLLVRHGWMGIHIQVPGRGRVRDAAWLPLTPELVRTLFANHGRLLKHALERLRREGGIPVEKIESGLNIL